MAKEIELTNGGIAVVDDSDFERASQHSWRHRRSGKTTYAVTTVGEWRQPRTLYLHRFIKYGLEDVGQPLIDHHNRNGLDCQKQNLRPATKSLNMANAEKCSKATLSRFKGVTFDRVNRKWIAQIKAAGKRIFLGRFKEEIEAAAAYKTESERLFGEFAYAAHA